MAGVLKADGLDLWDVTNYEPLLEGYDWTEPELRVELQPYLQDHGGSVIEASDWYDIVVHTVNIKVKGSSRANLHANVSALHAKVRKRDWELEFRYDGATNSNYAHVLFCKSKTLFDDTLVRLHNQTIVQLEFYCKPFWQGDWITLALQTLNPTPAKLVVGNVQGDVMTPAYLEFRGRAGSSYGDNLYVGRRKTPMPEADFQPVKDFSGTVESGTHGGQFKRQSVAASWVDLVGESTNLKGISMVDGLIGWAVGDNGMILKTTDGWATVASQTSGTTAHLKDVQRIDANTVYAVGTGGTILKTTNGGTAWSALSSGITDTLFACSFASATVGWVAGDYGIILKTSDGTAWTPQLADPVYRLYDIYAVDANTVYAVGYKGRMYKTTNGGTNWVATSAATVENLYGVHFTDASTGWVCGSGGTIRKTVNGGTDWSTQSSGTIADLYETKGGASTRWVVGRYGTILKTTNGGSTWAAQTSGVSAALRAAANVDANSTFIAGDGYTVLKTVNGGTTWTQPIAAWSLTSAYNGRYRIFARCRTYDATPTSVQVRVSSGLAGGSFVANAAVNMTVGSAWEWLDLGAVEVPIVNISDQVDAVAALKLEAIGTASANFDVDVAALLPVDGDACYVKHNATTDFHVSIDGEEEAVNRYRTTAKWVGTPIRLYPGDNNIVTLETSGVDGVDVVVKYRPRRLAPVA